MSVKAVIEVLERASHEEHFIAQLTEQGSKALGGYDLTWEEKAALISGGIQWPCHSTEHPGTPYLHRDKFLTPNGKARFTPLDYRPSAEEADTDYPFILTTKRSLYHYHASMTRKVEGLNHLMKEELLEINPLDALRLEINDGDYVKIISRRGEIMVKVKVTGNSPVGIVSMTFHFGETPTNILTNLALDPISKTPETKVTAVRIEKLKDGETLKGSVC